MPKTPPLADLQRASFETILRFSWAALNIGARFLQFMFV
jgi:hypothetical protein